MAGFDPDHFVIGAFASDGHDRRSLTPVARQRFVERHGRELPAEQTLIIGDTPHDVDCAKAHGCRCLAVLTGRHPAAELVGADRIVADLSATEDLAAWILSHAERGSSRTIRAALERRGRLFPRTRPVAQTSPNVWII